MSTLQLIRLLLKENTSQFMMLKKVLVNDTGVTIGFSEEIYSVGRDDGEVKIDIQLKNGTLQRMLTINLTIDSQTASGKFTSDVDIDNYVLSL